MPPEPTRDTALGGRIDRSYRMTGVVIGDYLVITAVIAVGVYTHSGLAGVTDPATVADATIPFLVGWLLAGVVVGAFRDRALESVGRAALVAFGTWLLADIVGQAIRATSMFGGNANPVFFLVLLGVGGVALTLWRTVASRL